MQNPDQRSTFATAELRSCDRSTPANVPEVGSDIAKPSVISSSATVPEPAVISRTCPPVFLSSLMIVEVEPGHVEPFEEDRCVKPDNRPVRVFIRVYRLGLRCNRQRGIGLFLAWDRPDGHFRKRPVDLYRIDHVL